MATSTVVPASISDWFATPAPFNPRKHGMTARFSDLESVVTRACPLNYGADCVVYTREPLPREQVWQTTVMDTSSKWGGYGGLVSECVLCIL